MVNTFIYIIQELWLCSFHINKCVAAHEIMTNNKKKRIEYVNEWVTKTCKHLQKSSHKTNKN